jgi:hypothetical protein
LALPDLTPAWAAAITRQLVWAGLEVSEVRAVRRPLREVFLELTGRRTGGADSVHDAAHDRRPLSGRQRDHADRPFRVAGRRGDLAGVPASPPGVAAWALAGYTAVFVGLTLVLWCRRDVLTGRAHRRRPRMAAADPVPRAADAGVAPSAAGLPRVGLQLLQEAAPAVGLIVRATAALASMNSRSRIS